MSDTKIKTSNIGNLAVTHALLHTDMDLTSKTVQVATPTSNTHPATKAYVDTEVANLIDSAPGTLDTLNELAAAINDDANFNATIASSIATKLPLAGGTLTGNLTLASTASGSSASPELELRRDITGVDANYLGQIKFTADNDADQNIVFAKITGKILDASDGTEDGIIEFAHKKAGSNNISARFRSDSLQLINGTNLTVAGTTDLTGDLTVDTNTLHVDTSNNKVGIGTTSPSSELHIEKAISGDQSQFRISNGTGATLRMGITGSDTNEHAHIKTNSAENLEFHIGQAANSTSPNVVFKSGGNIGIGNVDPVHPLHIYEDGGYYASIGRGNSTPGGSDPWLGLFNNTNIADATFGWGIYDSNANGSFQIWNKNNNTTGYDALTILRGGNVGIGTDNPSEKLHVSVGNVKIDTDTNSSVTIKDAGTNAVAIYAGTGDELYLGGNDSYALRFLNDGSNDVVFDNASNIGIGGATSPVAPLDIFPGSANGTMYDALVLRGGANSTQGSGVRLHMTGTGNDPLARGVILQSEMTNNGNNHDFSVWTSQGSPHIKRFTIDNQGQVAIGTDAPSGTRLHIKVPNSGSGLTDAVKIQDSSGYVDIAMYAGAADGEIRLGSAGQLRGKISGAGVGSRTDHNFDLYQNGTIAAGLRSSINGTGRRGLHMFGNSLGFDQSGVRSWEMRAEGGNLRMDSGDGYGKVQVNAGFKAKSIQLGNDSTSSTFGAQSGYMGDWWEAGHKAVYYLGYLGSSASTPGTANWFNFYTSGHWGQYTRVMVYSFNHYPGPGYSKWDITGTTVTQVEGRGSVGSVTSSQSTVSSNGHAGQPVYKYTVNFTMPGTYTQGPWFVAHVSGGGAGHLSNAHSDAQADAWFSTRGGGMYLRNVSTDAMKTSPMYVTGT